MVGDLLDMTEFKLSSWKIPPMIDSHIHNKYQNLGKYTFVHICRYMVRSGMVASPKAAIDLINTGTIDLNELVETMSRPPAPEISTSEDDESTNE